MRRVGAASLATINPMARPARDQASREGDVTEMFAETIQLPACIAPAAAAPAPAPAEPEPGPEPERLTWHERAARAIAARFRRAPRGEEPQGPDMRLERFQSRRSGPSPSK
jgi:hypothetical protein